ncbi:MAG: MFS transporter [Gammaproteobacteria bacterium]|nr:MFS transporter [Gammaproteobacteria bacterium]
MGVCYRRDASKVRYTVIALGYNVGTDLFGGAAPLIAALLVHWCHNQLAPAFYLMAMALLSLTALFLSWRYQVKKV